MSRLKLLYPATPIVYKGKSYPHITQHFGENLVPLYKELGLDGHNGLDMFAIDGAPVYAAHDGIVSFTGEDGSGGLGVVIRTTEKFDHDGGTDYIKSIYWHLKKNSFLVKPGDVVKVGQKIAEADNTGSSSGSHLHFGIKAIAPGEQDWEWYNLNQKNGYNGALNPEPYLYLNEMFSTPMRRGERSEEVAKLQRKLRQLGIFNYPDITGYYGEITRQAVYQFQKDYKVCSLVELEWVNGNRVGEKTIAKLNTV